MTYQEIFRKADFEETWKYLHDTLHEDERLKQIYKTLISKIKVLPIEFPNTSSMEPIKIKVGLEDFKFVAGTPDPQEWLLHREVVKDIGEGIEIFPNELSKVAAHLIYWSTLYSFKTQYQQKENFSKWLTALETEDLVMPEIEPAYISRSFENKKRLYWQDTLDKDYAYDWSSNLWIMKKKLEYNIGYWRYVQRHVGWERDVKRMQTCCNLLYLAAYSYTDITGIKVNMRNASRFGFSKKEDDFNEYYLKELRREKAFRLVWKYLDHNIKNWWD